MKFHYLILNKKLLLWNVMHSPTPISLEEVQTFLMMGAHDIIDITDPNEPKSMVIHNQN